MLAIACVLFGGMRAARADDTLLLLDVSINGRPIDLIGTFLLKNGVLTAKAKEWQSFGLILPSDIGADGNASVPITALPGVRGSFDTRQQTLALTVESAALKPHMLSIRSAEGAEASTKVDSGGYGAVLNYTIQETESGSASIANGLFDGRFYSSHGVLESSEVASNAPGTSHVIRLDTTYSFSDPEKLRQINVGDVTTTGLAWSRSLRLGGIQFSSDFSLQPDLVTFPIPTVRGSVAVPSTVDLLVNGVREFSQPVPAGPFELRQIPIVTGASNVSVVVQNALGQQTIQNLPFYTSGTLLASGLTSYGGELGAIRRNYSFVSDDYDTPAFNGSIRHGFNDWLTGEAHAEGTESLGVVGGGAAVKLGDIGIVSADVAGSKAGHNGFLYSVGFSRQSGNVSVNLSTTRTSSNYLDVADEAGDIGQRSVTQAGIGLSLGAFGFFGLSYNAISYRETTPVLLDTAGVETAPGTASILSATYSVQLHGTISFYATSFTDFSNHGSYGMTLGFAVPLGPRSTAGGYASREGRSDSVGLQASQSAVDIGDLGWNVNLAQGSLAQRQAQVDYKAPFGDASAAVDQSTGVSAGRLGLTGALVAAGGGVFAANTIDDSFAVVNAGGLAGIPVLRENRLVGKTDADGQLLIPDLRAYQANAIAVDPLSLPLDAQAGQLDRVVRPADRSGVVVNFAVKRGGAARLKLVDTQGRLLPLGTMVTVEASGSSAPIGYDGTTYLTDLAVSNVVDVTLADGTACGASFAYTAKPGHIPLIGPITCR